MNIRIKVLVILGALSLCLTFIFYALFKTVILNNFDKIETRFVNDSIARVKASIVNEAAALDTITHDWASWDDTYLFIEDRNKEYQKANIVADTFTSSAKIDYLLYFDLNANLVHGSFYDRQKEEVASVPLEFIAQLQGNSALFHHPGTESHNEGIIILSGSPLLIAARPILNSNGDGPRKGTLLMMRLFDDERIEGIKESTRADFTIHKIGSPLPDPYSTIPLASLLKAPDTVSIAPLNEDRVAGYFLQNDIFGDPQLFLRLVFPRDIHIQGQRTLNYLIWSSIGTCLFFALVIFLILDRVVLRRLATLNQDVLKISRTAQPANRVHLPGTDELATLSSSINTMLDAIERNQLDIREKEVRLRTIAEFTRSGLFITQESRLIYVNSVMELITGYDSEELFTMHWWDIFHPEYQGALRDRIMASQKVGAPPKHYEVLLQKKSGEESWLDMRIKHVTVQGRPASFCVCTDL
ncbi:MAG: PAS domain S-box protein [Desulfobulbaceae bacterium]|nr:PAS domain S-box protein [Desulfobulbaceae bacterium]